MEFKIQVVVQAKSAKLLFFCKALRNWKIFLKALSKQLGKLTIKMKRLWRLKFLSFVNVND